MLAYQLRLAWKSIRRNPILSLILVGGIGLGIGVAMVFVTAYYMMSGNPIPGKSDRLFYVRVDAWDPQSPWDDDHPDIPPDQLTYTDAMAFMQSDIPTHKAAMYKAQMTVHPNSEALRPYRAVTRMTFGDFFPMFNVPFRYGSGWDDSADAGPEPVVVLDDATNQKLFGGEDSVGKLLRIEDREFRVVGVLEPWRPQPKFYDTNNGPFDDPEEIFVPFRFGMEMELYSWGNTNGWKYYDGNEYEDFLASESIWIQMWAQLDDAAQKEEFASFLDAYALEQKKLGRFQRPINNELTDVMAWLKFEEVVPDEAKSLLVVALLFLLICSLNLIGFLLGKFLARSPEVGVRRALGASRRWVFVQHLIECELIGVAGAVLGLGLSLVGLRLVDRLFDQPFHFRPDLTMLVVAVGLALLSALVAGLYPAWRICSIQPGYHLKTQ